MKKLLTFLSMLVLLVLTVQLTSCEKELNKQTTDYIACDTETNEAMALSGGSATNSEYSSGRFTFTIAMETILFISISALFIIMVANLTDRMSDLRRCKDIPTIQFAQSTIIYGWITVCILTVALMFILGDIINRFTNIASVHA